MCQRSVYMPPQAQISHSVFSAQQQQIAHVAPVSMHYQQISVQSSQTQASSLQPVQAQLVQAAPQLPTFTSHQQIVPATSVSSITVTSPTPTITCLSCHAQSTPAFALLKCQCCNLSAFSWSCACSTQESKNAPKGPWLSPSPTVASVTPPQRPRRTMAHKTWTEQIKYISPIGRYTMYHKPSCQATDNEPQITTASIKFANAYRMKPAPCCH